MTAALQETLDTAAEGGTDTEALLELLRNRGLIVLTDRLKELGFKTGERLQLKQALVAALGERESAKRAAMLAARREAATAREARLGESLEELREQYAQATMSEVEKLKAARRKANAAKRAAEEEAEPTGNPADPSEGTQGPPTEVG